MLSKNHPTFFLGKQELQDTQQIVLQEAFFRNSIIITWNLKTCTLIILVLYNSVITRNIVDLHFPANQ